MLGGSGPSPFLASLDLRSEKVWTTEASRFLDNVCNMIDSARRAFSIPPPIGIDTNPAL
jgi:hypothetical protein